MSADDEPTMGESAPATSTTNPIGVVFHSDGQDGFTLSASDEQPDDGGEGPQSAPLEAGDGAEDEDAGDAQRTLDDDEDWW